MDGSRGAVDGSACASKAHGSEGGWMITAHIVINNRLFCGGACPPCSARGLFPHPLTSFARCCWQFFPAAPALPAARGIKFGAFRVRAWPYPHLPIVHWGVRGSGGCGATPACCCLTKVIASTVRALVSDQVLRFQISFSLPAPASAMGVAGTVLASMSSCLPSPLLTSQRGTDARRTDALTKQRAVN